MNIGTVNDMTITAMVVYDGANVNHQQAIPNWTNTASLLNSGDGFTYCGAYTYTLTSNDAKAFGAVLT